MTAGSTRDACRCGEHIARALQDVLGLARSTPAPLMTVEQAAERLGVDRHTLSRWVSAKKVSHTKLGGSTIRFTEENLADIVTAGLRRVLPAEPPADPEASTKLRFARDLARRAVGHGHTNG